jgi:hypothetical protein
MVTVARAIIGVSSGASTVLVPIYLGELVRLQLRIAPRTDVRSIAYSHAGGRYRG